jgi:hypothetical protein
MSSFHLALLAYSGELDLTPSYRAVPFTLWSGCAILYGMRMNVKMDKRGKKQ